MALQSVLLIWGFWLPQNIFLDFSHITDHIHKSKYWLVTLNWKKIQISKKTKMCVNLCFELRRSKQYGLRTYCKSSHILLHSFFAFYSLKYRASFLSCNLFIMALQSVLLIWGFWLPQNVLIFFGACLLSVAINFFFEIWVIMFFLTCAGHKIILKTFERKIWVITIN